MHLTRLALLQATEQCISLFFILFLHFFQHRMFRRPVQFPRVDPANLRRVVPAHFGMVSQLMVIASVGAITANPPHFIVFAFNLVVIHRGRCTVRRAICSATGCDHLRLRGIDLVSSN